MKVQVWNCFSTPQICKMKDHLSSFCSIITLLGQFLELANRDLHRSHCTGRVLLSCYCSTYWRGGHEHQHQRQCPHQGLAPCLRSHVSNWKCPSLRSESEREAPWTASQSSHHSPSQNFQGKTCVWLSLLLTVVLAGLMIEFWSRKGL